ncbi:MAG: Isoleucyl-tRNA synthetase [candidate division WS6 bacterium GW2011_GWF2_39_15]|uniref:Isoleucine--tRNA ligase n=1 Tax=candidate division WS6 bacterium GW2011_GWF2_39_15 TaxID=1619100 RepID=A0A0G0QWH5_9BACT|nr:MAG: Isoleucyl-tRNA synthetase [candidate division WS6 bacterium GW2011_GWF2_39_15]
MGKLRDVNQRQDFVQMENDLLKWWDEKGTVQKYMHKNNGKEKRFSFIDGPITANNPMGLHHAWARTYKDLVCRYKGMKGFDQRYQMGFDCQGLWVEVEVEKALGFNSKKDIYDYGLGNFTDACVARVNKYSAIQTEQSKRLGMFMDWENSYYTMSKENNLYIWNFLKKCHEKGLLYKNHSATTWCPRCETGLSEHEKADGYKEIEDTSVYVKFRILGRENEYLLAWTTTPWTLSANVLLAVNPKLEYVKAIKEGVTYYLASKPSRKLGFSEAEKVDVKELLDMKYESLYDIPAQKGVDHYVVKWELVSEDDGTGIVHIAPGCGQEDYELGLEVGAPAISPLDESGKYTEGYGDLTGKYAHDVKDEVFEYLKSKDLLFKTENFKHVYPHCWRCKTKCLFRLENNWFINLDKIREELKKEAEKADWVPDYAGKRMQDWLKNMGDWMISRKRFYGLSLPFYECDCGELTVVGGLEDLKKVAVDPSKVDNLKSIHRPWVDEIEIKCPKCGKDVSRVSDVGDCWLDAGVVPFSTLKYLEDKSYWEKWFPADYVTEMIEQVRLWFYSMLVFGVVMEGKVPYKKVLTFAEMRDESNDKMSKTKKNYIPFDEAADKVGSDLIRWNFALSPYGKNVRFGWSVIEDARRQFMLPLWNSYVYFVTYAKLHNWEYDKSFDENKLSDLMDRWVVNATKNVAIEVNSAMDNYSFYTAATRLQDYVMDLSTWYIRRSRDRFKGGNPDALNTLYYALVSLVKLLAPFMPFITEEMYQNLVIGADGDNAKESVHLEDYPEFTEADLDLKVLETMEKVRKLSSIGLKIRDEKKIKLRQPLGLAYTNLKEEQYLPILQSELNVSEVKYTEKEVAGDNLTTLKDGLDFITLSTELTKELKQAGLYREVARAVQNLRKEAGLVVGQKVRVLLNTQSDLLKSVVSDNIDKLATDVGATSVKLEDSLDNAMLTVVESQELAVKFEK